MANINAQGPAQLQDEQQEPPDYEPVPMIASPPESGFGARVKAARTHYRLNVEALSRLTKFYDELDARGVSGAAISRYEGGDALPGAREFRLIADALNLSPDWLLFGTIATGGKTDAQQRLIAALLAVIGEQQTDANIGGSRQTEWLKATEMMKRRRLIAEARKPQDQR